MAIAPEATPPSTTWMSNTNGGINNYSTSGSKGRPLSLPITKTTWRQLDVTIDDVSSDSSDGGADGPERSEFISLNISTNDTI